MKQSRSAFSMIELVFVIVVLGIVSSIGASIIAKAFETYVIQKATYNASVKTELAAQQIANRLANSVPWTFVAKAPGDHAGLVVLRESPADNARTVLEWVGIDNDSFSAVTPPGWSGYCDISTSDPDQCDTQGSNPVFTATVIQNLSGPTATTASTIADSAVFFKTDDYNSVIRYSPRCIGFANDGDTTCAVGVNTFVAGPPPILTFDDVIPKIRAEQYALSWSAYTLEPVFVRATPDGTQLHDLNLFYGYQPWENEIYNGGGRIGSTLISNVTVFKFTQLGNTIRFKLCVLQQIGTGGGDVITVCKEKAVVR